MTPFTRKSTHGMHAHQRDGGDLRAVSPLGEESERKRLRVKAHSVTDRTVHRLRHCVVQARHALAVHRAVHRAVSPTEHPTEPCTGCFQQCAPQAIYACVPAAESCAWRCPPPPPLRSGPPRPAAHPPAVCTQRACRPRSTPLSLPAVPSRLSPSPHALTTTLPKPSGANTWRVSPPALPLHSHSRAWSVDPSPPLTGARGILTVSWVPTDV
jgi:hypothetical protein